MWYTTHEHGGRRPLVADGGEEAVGPPGSDADVVVYQPDAKVDKDGRIQIEKRKREMYGLDGGDILDVIIETMDGEAFFASDIRLSSDGRITIPYTQRRLYGVEPGEYVHAELHPTGKHLARE